MLQCQQMPKRLLSGIQPTGELHIGNYLGAIKQWVEYQPDYDTFIMVADYHSLSARPKPDDLHQRTLDLIAILIACGIDPKSSTLFVQSQLPAHAELGWILGNFTSLGQLNRMTQFKEKSDQFGQNLGLYSYPVLQTADIALYNADVVPVGDDQIQHLELAREIIRSLNNFAQEKVLVEPKPLLNTAARIMALNDPTKKMSKSIPGSAIGLQASEDEISRTIKRAVTDSDPNAAEMSGALKNLMTILEGVSDHQAFTHIQSLHKNGKLQYSELKEQLIEDLIAFLAPIQKTYDTLRKDEKALRRIVEEGKAKAEPVATATLQKVKTALGLL